MAGLKGLKLGTKTPLRIAAYCRVSTEMSSQEESFEAQRNFFLNEVTKNRDWILAGIYADNARTATMIRGRTDFQRMMRHAEAHQFDYIITKSISRFSRNTSDTMRSISRLNALGIGVYFMEQGFDTMKNESGMVLSVLASIAEMESKSISQNVKITLDRKNSQGTPTRKCCYGYEKSGAEWAVNRKQAIRVKLGYLMAAHGYCFTEIAERLNRFEAIDKTGRNWDCTTVREMLKNEAYAGDILTNKTTVRHDDEGKRQVANDAIVDQYYIDCHHDPIVGRPIWQQVSGMAKAKELAGQANFRKTYGTERWKCMEKIEELKLEARRDRLLSDVKKYLPAEPGRWMRGEG